MTHFGVNELYTELRKSIKKSTRKQNETMIGV